MARLTARPRIEVAAVPGGGPRGEVPMPEDPATRAARRRRRAQEEEDERFVLEHAKETGLTQDEGPNT
jgi:hypothetical protein